MTSIWMHPLHKIVKFSKNETKMTFAYSFLPNEGHQIDFRFISTEFTTIFNTLRDEISFAMEVNSKPLQQNQEMDSLKGKLESEQPREQNMEQFLDIPISLKYPASSEKLDPASELNNSKIAPKNLEEPRFLKNKTSNLKSLKRLSAPVLNEDWNSLRLEALDHRPLKAPFSGNASDHIAAGSAAEASGLSSDTGVIHMTQTIERASGHNFESKERNAVGASPFWATIGHSNYLNRTLHFPSAIQRTPTDFQSRTLDPSDECASKKRRPMSMVLTSRRFSSDALDTTVSKSCDHIPAKTVTKRDVHDVSPELRKNYHIWTRLFSTKRTSESGATFHEKPSKSKSQTAFLPAPDSNRHRNAESADCDVEKPSNAFKTVLSQVLKKNHSRKALLADITKEGGHVLKSHDSNAVSPR
ncbi:hypothetical protein HDU97_001309 [Phlyctochytrium planicorne]|nr:hypothetical protein HDU97_001309 [Phlyctochytrium planicorne]